MTQNRVNEVLVKEGFDLKGVITENLGSAHQVLDLEGNLLGYVMHEGWKWKGSMKAK